MATTVKIAFDLSITTPVNFFTLDDATRGVLDNTTYVLGGDTLQDVTSDVQSVQIRRGRSRQLERFTAGNANVVLRNFGPSARKYDPLNTASPYYGQIVPRKQVVIDVDGTPIFTGSVADWNFTYGVSGESYAEPSCTDSLAIVANQTLQGGTATSQLTGARVDAILTEIGWPSTQRTIATGQATLDADYVRPDTNALTYLSTVADVSEPGAFFVGKAGDFVFKSRDQLQTFSSGLTLGSGGIPFTEMEVVYGIEELYNSVSVTYTAGTVTAGTVTVENLSSQASYGTFSQTYNTVLSDITQATALANWQSNIYSTPKYRVNSLTIALSALTSAQRLQVVGLELGDGVLVAWTPNGVGSPINQYSNIEGIEHSVSPEFHTVRFTLSPTSVGFTLDSSSFGVLDQNVLGF